jgi:hypothetical protein
MAGEPRTPRFELHILPLMRQLDRDHMLGFGFDLWSYDEVRARAGDIIQVLEAGTMPPKSHGGPWPKEWIDLFVRWKDAEFPRLQRGQAAGGYTASRSGTNVALVARGRVPSPGFTVWLNLETTNPNQRVYSLVQEPPHPPQTGPDRPFTARERFDDPSASLTITVLDADGEHDVPVQAGTFLHMLGSPSQVHAKLHELGFTIVAEDAPSEGSAIATRGGHVLHMVSDRMFTELRGDTAALDALASSRVASLRK